MLELADPLGPWGARGMAEMGMIPYAPAVVAALHDATGVWFDSFPLTPDRVLAGLADAVRQPRAPSNRLDALHDQRAGHECTKELLPARFVENRSAARLGNGLARTPPGSCRARLETECVAQYLVDGVAA